MKKFPLRNLLLIILMRIRHLRRLVFHPINFLSGISRMQIGSNVNILTGLNLSGRGKILLGNNSIIKKNVRLVVNDGDARIIIGEGVQIEDNVQLICQNSGEIRIGNGSILGRGVKIVCYEDAKINISENVTFQEQSDLKTNSLVSIGIGSVIGKYSSIAPREQNGSGYFTCGTKCVIHVHNFFDTTDAIELGNEVATGPYDIFYTHDHETKRDQSIWDQSAVTSKIALGDGSWIGSQVVILPGVQVGKGAVIAAGAVVTSPVEDFNIVAGVPARFLRERS